MTLGLGDIGVSGHVGDMLVTHALGSCVAVLVRDRRHDVCGLVHVVLPTRPPAGSAPKVGYYAPTAVPALLEAVKSVGGHLGWSQVLLVGGAAVVDGLQSFDLGRRNVLAVRKALWSVGIVPFAEDVEGTVSRTVSIEVGTGAVQIRNPEVGTWSIG